MILWKVETHSTRQTNVLDTTFFLRKFDTYSDVFTRSKPIVVDPPELCGGYRIRFVIRYSQYIHTASHLMPRTYGTLNL